MDSATNLKSCLKQPAAVKNGLAAKVRNIDGKLRMATRCVNFTQPLSDKDDDKVHNGVKDNTLTSLDVWEDPRVQEMQDVATVGEASNASKVTKSFLNAVQSCVQSQQQDEEFPSQGQSLNKAKFRQFFNDKTVVDSDCVLPLANLQAIKQKFENTLMGYFVGKSVAFPLVKNYVTNTWSKFGFQKVIRDEDYFFFFKFNSITGVEQVLEQGPWMIRNTPIILNKWSPNLSLCKDKVTSIPVWVKLDRVPVVAYSEDGLSLIASQIGKPVMLDAFTTSMCNDPWGCIGFTRALIDVSATTELKKEVIMAVPHEDRTGHTKVQITAEFEWNPLLCMDCHVFGHMMAQCPKRVVEHVTTTEDDKFDGFTTATNKRRKGKKQVNHNINKLGGMKLNRPNTFEYRPVAASKEANKEVNKEVVAKPATDVPITNVFSAHNDDMAEETIVAETPNPKGAALPLIRILMFSVAAWNIRGLNRALKQLEVWQVVNENQLSICAILESHVDLSLLSNVWNNTSEQRQLWTDLGLHKYVVCVHPWILMGDFNVALNMEDSFSGSSRLNAAMYDFKACVNNIEVMDINALGLHYTSKALDKNHNDLNLREEEAVYVQAFTDAKINKERFLKQKAKIEWLEVGDSNSAFFHKSVKSRNQSSRIEVIRGAGNVEVTDGLFTNVISADTRLYMIRMVTNDEIKSFMFNIGEDRAPGPDGFTFALFKKSWEVVGNDIYNAVKDFFVNGKLLKEINHTFFDLIPKVSTPLKVNDYQPISYCNVLYKCISKILTNRIIEGVKEVVSENQSAFILATFSLIINGDIHGYFQGKRGLRKGDLILPYLFTLVMECLTLIIKYRVRMSVLSSMHVYWASVLVIPKGILLDIQQYMRGFLWCNGELKRAWLLKAPNLGLMPMPILEESRLDTPQWKDANGRYSNVLVKYSWDALRTRGTKPMAHRRTAKSIIGRILVVVASYFIWVEHNNRMFKNVRRPPEEIRDLIIVTVRLKLLTFSPDDEEDTRSSHEYLNDLEEEYQAGALLAKSKRLFKNGTQRFSSAKATDQTECHKCGKKGHFARDCWLKTLVLSYQSPFQPKPLSSSQHKPELRPTKDSKAKYNKVKAKLALLSSSASASKASMVKNKDLIAEAYEWDEKEVSSDDNEMVEVKVLMELAEDNDAVSKEGARNGKWVKISMRKVHTLLEMEDNDDRKTYLDYLCIHLNYVEEQRNNLLSKHRDHILKENNNLRTELKELTAITETWLNSSNKVNQCISKQIPSQKKRILGVDQLTEDPSRILPAESQRNTTDPLVTVTDSSAIYYDSADESSVCNTPLPTPKKLDGVELVSGPKTIKSILRSKSTFKAETLKGVILNEPSSAPARGNKSSSALKVNSAPAGKLKSVKINDDPPLAIVKNIKGKILGSDGKPLKSILKRPKIVADSHGSVSSTHKEDGPLTSMDGENITPVSVDGKRICKDGKPLMAVRRGVFLDPIHATNVTSNDNATVSHFRACNKEGPNSAVDGNIPIARSFIEVVSPDSADKQDGRDVPSQSDCANDNVPVFNKRVNFRTLINEEFVANNDTMLPKAAKESVMSRYSNTLMGYFVGKSLAFQIVTNYVTKTWAKFGLSKLMKTDNGVFLFKFDTKSGMDQVIERGPWLIRITPLILNKWAPNVLLKPGQISFARALIEIHANSELKKEVRMAIPIDDDDGTGYTSEVICVEYEWTSPHCLECKIFGHNSEKCPKKVNALEVNGESSANNNDGFTKVINRRNKGEKVSNQMLENLIAGIHFHKPKSSFYRPINKHANDKQSKKKSTANDKASTSGEKSTPVSNAFDALNSEERADLGDSNPYKDVGKAHVDGDAQNRKHVNEEVV
ncbi:uncharacterized mitochondrial protein-like protein, partial [Tanacetum coccineum]